jgi:hypothetical protein
MNRRVRELVLISLLAAFCGGLAFAHDRELFAAAFAAAAVVFRGATAKTLTRSIERRRHHRYGCLFIRMHTWR